MLKRGEPKYNVTLLFAMNKQISTIFDLEPFPLRPYFIFALQVTKKRSPPDVISFLSHMTQERLRVNRWRYHQKAITRLDDETGMHVGSKEPMPSVNMAVSLADMRESPLRIILRDVFAPAIVRALLAEQGLSEGGLIKEEDDHARRTGRDDVHPRRQRG